MSLIVDSIIAISRLTKDPDNSNKESYVPNLALTSIKCQIQPASPEQTALADGIFGQTHVIFTTTSGIFSGDRITVSGTGETFKVKGVEDWSQIVGIPHYEIVIARMLEEEVLY